MHHPEAQPLLRRAAPHAIVGLAALAGEVVLLSQHDTFYASEIDGIGYMREATMFLRGGPYLNMWWPPGFAMLVAALYTVTGSLFIAANVLTGAAGVAMAVCLHAVWRRLWNPTVAAWATVLLLADLTFVSASARATRCDLVGAAFVWVGVVAFLWGGRRASAPTAFIWGLASTIRYVYLPMVLPAAVLAARSRRGRTRLLAAVAAVALFVAGTAPTLWIDARNGWRPYQSDSHLSVIFAASGDFPDRTRFPTREQYPSLLSFVVERPLAVPASIIASTVRSALYLVSIRVPGSKASPYRLLLPHAGLLGLLLLLGRREALGARPGVYWGIGGYVFLLSCLAWTEDRYLLAAKPLLLAPAVAVVLALASERRTRVGRIALRALLPAALLLNVAHVAAWYRPPGQDVVVYEGALRSGELARAAAAVRVRIPVTPQASGFADSTMFIRAHLEPDYVFGAPDFANLADMQQWMADGRVDFAVVAQRDVARAPWLAPVLGGAVTDGLEYIYLDPGRLAIVARGTGAGGDRTLVATAPAAVAAEVRHPVPDDLHLVYREHRGLPSSLAATMDDTLAVVRRHGIACAATLTAYPPPDAAGAPHARVGCALDAPPERVPDDLIYERIDREDVAMTSRGWGDAADYRAVVPVLKAWADERGLATEGMVMLVHDTNPTAESEARYYLRLVSR